MENLIGPEEASKALGIELATVYTWVTRRKIPFIKVGGALRFRPSSLQKWIEEHEFPAASAKASRGIADLLVDQSGTVTGLRGAPKKDSTK